MFTVTSMRNTRASRKVKHAFVLEEAIAMAARANWKAF